MGEQGSHIWSTVDVRLRVSVQVTASMLGPGVLGGHDPSQRGSPMPWVGILDAWLGH